MKKIINYFKSRWLCFRTGHIKNFDERTNREEAEYEAGGLSPMYYCKRCGEPIHERCYF